MTLNIYNSFNSMTFNINRLKNGLHIGPACLAQSVRRPTWFFIWFSQLEARILSWLNMKNQVGRWPIELKGLCLLFF